MLIRDLAVKPYEFGEVLQLVVSERSGNAFNVLFYVRVPLGQGNIEHHLSYSVNASKGVVPNQIAREVFHLMNFLEQKDWRDNMSSYADFCDGKF